MKELIAALENRETYFGMVEQISSDEGITKSAAYERVEEMRQELGLPKKYNSFMSYANSRSRYHRSGQGIERFDFQSYLM